MKEQNAKSAASGKVTQKEVGVLSNKNAEIERVLKLIGDTPSPNYGRDLTKEENALLDKYAPQ